MKKIFKYFGVILSVALLGSFTACGLLEQEEEMTDVELGIKTFSPQKVVAGMEMTINGARFDQVTEIVFPEEVVVTSFTKVTNEMLRVTVPSGISVEGGKIIVRGEGVQAESKMDLTVGNTSVTGFSKQPGEEITGGDQLTVYGNDLEFINKVELLDSDGNVQYVEDKSFYRKGTNMVVFYIPKKNIYEGSWVGKLHTIDGKVFPLPELAYTPASDGGHWETVKSYIWQNDDPEGHGAVSWNGIYRFALEGTDGNSEAIAEIPADVWEKMKTTPFYVQYTAPDPTSYQVRVTTGWWSVQWLGSNNDIAPWSMAERIIDNEDGTFSILVDFSEDPAILDVLDEQHLLFTGSGYTPTALYFTEDVWVGEGHMEIVKTSIWKNDDPEGHGAVSWNGVYRFALEGTDGNSEAIAEIPTDTWTKMMSEGFYMLAQGSDWVQMRITTGWWSTTWTGEDITTGNERIIDNGDGTYYIYINFEGDPILDVIDVQHLLFTGGGFTPLELYFQEEVWVGADSGPKEVVIWESDGSAGAVSWDGTYRFSNESNKTGEEIYAIPDDVWAKMMSGSFFLKAQGSDWVQMRITTGWWSTTWTGEDITTGNERIIDNEDGTYYIEINFDGDPILDVIDAQHLLFTGGGYTPLKLYFME